MLTNVLSNPIKRVIALLMMVVIIAAGVFSSASVAAAATPAAPQSGQSKSVQSESEPTYQAQGKISQAIKLLKRYSSQVNAAINNAIDRLPVPQYVKNNLKSAISITGIIGGLQQVSGPVDSLEEAYSKGLQQRYWWLNDAWADRIAGAIFFVVSPI